jgi:hypothetical protein
VFYDCFFQNKYRIEGWLGLTAGLGPLEKRGISVPLRIQTEWNQFPQFQPTNVQTDRTSIHVEIYFI